MSEAPLPIPGEQDLLSVLAQYRESFSIKEYAPENDERDVLMDVFGISPGLKRENRQFWGRELGMCWQRIVSELFQATIKEYGPGLRQGADELCDLIAARDAIDTKYRIGSGDAGTLKKFKQYGKKLSALGLRPVLLIVRTDNLAAAITACETGGWIVLSGPGSFEYIHTMTGVRLDEWLKSLAKRYHIQR